MGGVMGGVMGSDLIEVRSIVDCIMMLRGVVKNGRVRRRGGGGVDLDLESLISGWCL